MTTNKAEKLEKFLEKYEKGKNETIKKAVEDKIKTVKESQGVVKSIDLTQLKAKFDAKKGAVKTCDAISVNMPVLKTVKEASKEAQNKTEVLATVVINTTNLLDTHDDVHIKGLWDDFLATKAPVMHLQEHMLQFDKIIADGNDVKAYVKEFTWKELGYNFEGSTQALVFESNVKAERNAFMFNQYSKGFVKNHSVRMEYVEFNLAVNDPDYKEEFATWNKYINEIANKEHAEAQGYFFAVTKGNVIEGSAVPIGSNFATPTISVKNETENTEIVEKTGLSEDLIQLDEEEIQRQNDEKFRLETEIFLLENDCE